MSDPIEPFVQLGRRITEILARGGLDLREVHFVPDLDGPHHHLDFVATLRPDWVPGADPAAFEAVMADAHQAEVEARFAAARDELSAHLRHGRGFLSDPPTTPES